jgi:hypothetical protein
MSPTGILVIPAPQEPRDLHLAEVHDAPQDLAGRAGADELTATWSGDARPTATWATRVSRPRLEMPATAGGSRAKS